MDTTITTLATAAPTLTVLGASTTLAVVLAGKGRLQPLIAALAKLITEPLAIIRHLVERQSENAQEKIRWRNRVALAKEIQRDPGLLTALRNVDELMGNPGEGTPGTDSDAPPPDRPPTAPGTLVDLAERRARRASSGHKPGRTDDPA
jgi:hypothetical protein